MRSLAEHLRDTETHDRLPFHPSCPICRDTRLHGTLTTGGVVSPRAQALMAASVLAVSTAAPATLAFAAEPDQEQDGTAPVAQSSSPDPADSPDFDPGGSATDLPNATPPAPQAQAPVDAPDNAAPMTTAPAADPVDPVVDSGDAADTTSTEPAAATEATTTSEATTTPTPPVAPPAQAATTDTTPAPAVAPVATPPPTPTEPVAPGGRLPRLARHGTEHSRKLHRSHARPRHTLRVTTQAVTPPAPVAPTPAAPPPTVAPSAAATTSGATVKPGDRVHTVVAGDSLWAIAGDLLGADATPASIAREVHRLWMLNRDHIGTGDPNLLMMGTRLTLR